MDYPTERQAVFVLAIFLALVGCGGPPDGADEQASAPWLEQAVSNSAQQLFPPEWTVCLPPTATVDRWGCVDPFEVEVPALEANDVVILLSARARQYEAPRCGADLLFYVFPSVRREVLPYLLHGRLVAPDGFDCASLPDGVPFFTSLTSAYLFLPDPLTPDARCRAGELTFPAAALVNKVDGQTAELITAEAELPAESVLWMALRLLNRTDQSAVLDQTQIGYVKLSGEPPQYHRCRESVQTVYGPFAVTLPPGHDSTHAVPMLAPAEPADYLVLVGDKGARSIMPQGGAVVRVGPAAEVSAAASASPRAGSAVEDLPLADRPPPGAIPPGY